MSNSKLAEVSAHFVAEATKAFTASRDKADIKEATTRIRALLKEWDATHEATRRAMAGLLGVVQSGCDHAGAERGCNDRDGNWMNACPHCGYSS